MIRLAVIACLCALGTIAQAEDAVTACRTPAANIDQVTVALASQGWELRDLTALDDRTIDQLAWMRVARFLQSGSGGESVQTIFDIQRKSVLGLARQADLSTSKTRVMTRGDRTAFISWRLSPMGPTELDCAFTGPPPKVSNNIRVSEFPGVGLTITETSLGYNAGDL